MPENGEIQAHHVQDLAHPVATQNGDVISGNNELQIDVDDIFGRHTVAEVREIEKSIKSRCSTQLESLRQMVGRRYRDLIDASAAIAHMRAMSDELCTDIDGVKHKVAGLEGCGVKLVGEVERGRVKIRDGDSVHNLSANFVNDCLLKLCINSPAMIRRSLEPCQNGRDTTTRRKLVDAVKLLELTYAIEQAVSLYLNEDGPRKVLLLKSKSDLAKVKHLIRENLCITWLSTENDEESAREYITKLVHFAAITVSMAKKVFGSDGDKNHFLLMDCLKGYEKEAPAEHPILQGYLSVQSGAFQLAVHDKINGQRVHERTPLSQPPLGVVKTQCNEWLQKLSDQTSNFIKDLLTQSCPELPILTGVKKSALTPSQQSEDGACDKERSVLCESVLKDVFGKLSNVPLNDRAKELLRNSVAAAFRDFTQKLGNCRPFGRLSALPSESEDQENVRLLAVGISKELRKFVVFFITSEICACDLLGSNLARCQTELEEYLQPSVSAEESHDQLNVAVRDACMLQIDRLVETLNRNDCDGSTVADADANRLRCYAACVGLAETCQPLQKVFLAIQGSPSGNPTSHSKTEKPHGEAQWSECVKKLQAAVENSFRPWFDKIVDSVIGEHKVSSAPDQFINAIQAFDTIPVETDEGSVSIRAPASPSQLLSAVLRDVSLRLMDCAPHKLPRTCTNYAMNRLASRLAAMYSEVSSCDSLLQPAALQFTLDCLLLMLVTDDKETLGKLESTVSVLSQHVDPFDMHLLKPILEKNALVSAAKLSAVFTTLGAHKLPSTSTGAASATNTPANTQLLVLGNESMHRVELVPLPASLDWDLEHAHQTELMAKGKDLKAAFSLGSVDVDVKKAPQDASSAIGVNKGLYSSVMSRISSAAWFSANE